MNFVYVSSQGKIIGSISEFHALLNRKSIEDIPDSVLINIIEYLDPWSRFSLGLTCKKVYGLCFNAKFNPKSFLTTVGFTEATKQAYRSKIIAGRIEGLLGFRPLPIREKWDLFDHQLRAISFMRERESNCQHGIRGGIIQMKMGLGKTLVSLAYSLTSPRPSESEQYGDKGFPTLVIAGKTVMKQWKFEIEKFFGNRIKALYLHQDYMKPKQFRNLTRREVVKYDIVVTSYGVVRSIGKMRGFVEEVVERAKSKTKKKGKILRIRSKTRRQADKPSAMGLGIVFGTPWERVIADESQYFCNPDTNIFPNVMAIYGKSKWCLTGTPIINRSTDLWTQLRFCGYKRVKQPREWATKSEEYMKKHSLGDAVLQMNHKDAKVELPKLHEIKPKLTLEGDEKEIYSCAQKMVTKAFKASLIDGTNYSQVLATFIRLRQCCIAPYLMLDKAKRKKAQSNVIKIYEEKHIDWLSNRDGTAGIRSKKITKIVEILRLIPEGEKVLVFSSFTSALDLLAYACEVFLPNFNLLQLDGDTPGKERAEVLKQFRTDPDNRALFMTYRVGAEGLNLTEANHVVCIEPWWNQALHNQAISRVWRFGQNKEVFVYNPLIVDSVEGKLVKLCLKKEELSNSLLSETFKKSGLDIRTMGEILGVF